MTDIVQIDDGASVENYDSFVAEKIKQIKALILSV
jgi:hypothetical protein